MKIRRIKTLPNEIFKTVNVLNSNVMKNIFTSKKNSKILEFELLIY